MRRPRRRAVEDSIATQWAVVLAVLGAIALVVSGVWWWMTPESERYFECQQLANRKGCESTSGGLGGPMFALVLGLLGLTVAALIAIEARWRSRRPESAVHVVSDTT